MSANNTVILIGRLTKDPEVRYSQGQNGSMAIASFSLAVDRGDQNHNTDFINCKAFGKRGEFAEKYLKKGTKVVVKGSWQTGNYTNQSGQKIYTNDCMVEDVSFAESKNSNGGSGNDLPQTSLRDELPQMQNTQATLTRPATDSDGFMVVNDDMGDLPFANVR